jgi:hypothetical protein
MSGPSCDLFQQADFGQPVLLVHRVRLRRSSLWRLRTITCDRSLWFESHQPIEYVCVGLSFVANVAEDVTCGIIAIS